MYMNIHTVFLLHSLGLAELTRSAFLLFTRCSTCWSHVSVVHKGRSHYEIYNYRYIPHNNPSG